MYHEDDDEEEAFYVSPEELAILKDELAKEFPNDNDYMSDAYLLSVASKPYSKDMTIRRPLEVSYHFSVIFVLYLISILVTFFVIVLDFDILISKF